MTRLSGVDADLAAVRNLAQAKEALIGWSAYNDTAPGKLPCPEDTSLIGTVTEGQAMASCSNSVPVIGRLPWRTLGLPRPDDRGGRGNIWYALSPGFRNAPINSDTPAQLTVDGLANAAVAVLIAAGPPLDGQSRPLPTASSPPDIAQYLEDTNKSGTGNFTTKGSATFNDRLLAISARDLFSVVEKRVAREVWRGLLNFYCGENNHTETGTCATNSGGQRFFPRPAEFSDASCLGTAGITATNCTDGSANNWGRIPANPPIDWEPTLSLLRGTIGSTPNWFQKNGWRELVYYAVANACIDGTMRCNGSGMLTVNRPPGAPLNNQSAVVIVAGSALDTTTPAQQRALLARLDPSNYLEGENLIPSDNTYISSLLAPGTPFNDQLISLPLPE